MTKTILKVKVIDVNDCNFDLLNEVNQTVRTCNLNGAVSIIATDAEGQVKKFNVQHLATSLRIIEA